MKIAVFSDSHYTVEPMLAAIEAEKPDLVLHLGDHVSDAERIAERFPLQALQYVRGNCDVGSRAEETICFTVEGVRIFMTHGHRYDVKFQYESLANAAHFSGAQLALFGHTHIAEYRCMGDVTIFNPGSVGTGSHRSYGIVTVEGGDFRCTLKEV